MRNYNIINLIRKAVSDQEISRLFERMFNRMESKSLYAAALSSSVELYLSLKYLGRNPILVLGTVGIDNLSFPHVWIELDQKIYDVAIYFDSKMHPVLKDKIDVVMPQINRTYDNADINYFAFQFSDTFEMSDLKRVIGANMKEYCDNNPTSDMWADICYILGISQIPTKINPIKEFAQKEIIKDKDD